jgi:hypothetical protein
MNLDDFIKQIKTTPVPVSIVSGGKIVDGIGRGKWTAEQITAEVFNQDILSVDTDTWESALQKVKNLL